MAEWVSPQRWDMKRLGATLVDVYMECMEYFTSDATRMDSPEAEAFFGVPPEVVKAFVQALVTNPMHADAITHEWVNRIVQAVNENDTEEIKMDFTVPFVMGFLIAARHFHDND